MTATAPTILATCAGFDPGSWSDVVYGPLMLEAVRLARVPGARAPRVLHLNTAGGDPRFVEGTELEAARLAGVEASHLRFFPHPNVPSLRDTVMRADVVWVSGGSVVNLLAIWRAHGLDHVLQDAWRAGVVLAGGSAGGLCWHTGGVTTSFGPAASVVADGLGFVPGSLAVHYDSDASRAVAYEGGIASGVLAEGIALDEGTGVVYRDDGDGPQFVEALTQHVEGRVLRVTRDGDRAVTTPLETRLLA
ncbi:peptidase [Frondihabitans sp. PAMC 28766]|uniref:Type 1 glutamine amidotransferase-like domain-containing protein n=1 Tax=Frondihabitans sp. PAMC 28766 TaxID=1795630 RepID=UPI00078D3696|nr:Type 1 glutamine amidotransferase-like domain-containing protein [Frondihabitans sp. PAMC 28766]AMM19118.1 peptidase [Frondihabitans sp. PAMC 28766]